MAAKRVRGQDERVDHYAAALNYLELVMSPDDARELVDQLRRARTVDRKAKDLLRASRLPLLPRTNASVRKHLAKVRAGDPMSPLLLVRGRIGKDAPLTIAEGYHRLCAAHYVNEELEIPCRIVDLR